MTDREVLQDLLEAIDLAIYSGDWKVDGACDPDIAISRAKKVLEQPKTWIGLTLKDMPNKYMGNKTFIAGAKWAAKQLKANNVPKD